ncbi:MAG: peptidoglycan DD-metalloendopeptidase family protein [Anaerolineales bacterium]|nr:peptidoglycan DD-metalloendopeptidase family protein [Anaerolineales bacterium]
MNLLQRISAWACLCGLLASSACTPAQAVAPPTFTPCPEGQDGNGICLPTSLTITASLAVESLSPTQVGPEQPQATAPPAATPQLPTPAPALTVTATPLPTQAATPCLPDLCSYTAQFFLQRPIAAPGVDKVDITYRFGSTQSGRREPHHGVEFLNPYGTPVLAAADGVVVVAGDDRQPTSERGVWPITYYGLFSYFYGNLVVIEHSPPPTLQASFPELAGPVYTLYAHLSEISASVGQAVKAGQEIGKVGMSGVAEGPHLHFEVRLGENTYQASHNPELWLIPHTDENGQQLGALAGRVLNSYGQPPKLESLVIEYLPDGPDQPGTSDIHLLPYEEKALLGRPPWQESFGLGDLKPGWYRITFPYFGLQEFLVQVFPGQLTVVTIRPE